MVKATIKEIIAKLDEVDGLTRDRISYLGPMVPMSRERDAIKKARDLIQQAITEILEFQ